MQHRPTVQDIEDHLSRCDNDFTPRLSSRVSLPVYAQKLHQHALLFTEWHDGVLVALLAAYDNQKQSTFFISNVSVEKDFSRRGIASHLIDACLTEAVERQVATLSLEVHPDNHAALAFYHSHGFIKKQQTTDTILMIRTTGLST